MKSIKFRGFTIVEIAVVISVISILFMITIVAFNRVQADSRDQKRKSDVLSVMHELDNYYQKNGSYPLSCNFSTTSTDDCPSVAANYTSSTGFPAPPTIGSVTNLAALRAILPNIGDNIGDPKAGGSNPINQHATSPVNPIYIAPGTYYLLSLDGYNFGTASFFATTNTAVTISCNFSAIGSSYSGVANSGRPHPYVMAYYSEADNKWVFFHGPKDNTVNDLRWNYDDKPECRPSN